MILLLWDAFMPFEGENAQSVGLHLHYFHLPRAKQINALTVKHLSKWQCVGNQNGKCDKKSIRIHSAALLGKHKTYFLFEWREVKRDTHCGVLNIEWLANLKMDSYKSVGLSKKSWNPYKWDNVADNFPCIACYSLETFEKRFKKICQTFDVLKMLWPCFVVRFNKVGRWAWCCLADKEY